MQSFKEYIKEHSYQNEKGLNIISVNEVFGAWHEYMRELENAYEQSNHDLKNFGQIVEYILKNWKVIT